MCAFTQTAFNAAVFAANDFIPFLVASNIFCEWLVHTYSPIFRTPLPTHLENVRFKLIPCRHPTSLRVIEESFLHLNYNNTIENFRCVCWLSPAVIAVIGRWTGAFWLAVIHFVAARTPCTLRAIADASEWNNIYTCINLHQQMLSRSILCAHSWIWCKLTHTHTDFNDVWDT